MLTGLDVTGGACCMTNGDLALDSCMCDESVGVVWPPVSRTGSSAGLYYGVLRGCYAASPMCSLPACRLLSDESSDCYSSDSLRRWAVGLAALGTMPCGIALALSRVLTWLVRSHWLAYSPGPQEAEPFSAADVLRAFPPHLELPVAAPIPILPLWNP